MGIGKKGVDFREDRDDIEPVDVCRTLRGGTDTVD